MTWNFPKIESALLAAALDPGVWPQAIDCVSSETHSRCLLRSPQEAEEGAVEVDASGGNGGQEGRQPGTYGLAGRGQLNMSWVVEVRGEAGNVVWKLAAQRRPGIDPPFSSQEKRKFERLSQSLSRAVMIAQALDRASTSAALEAFDVSNIAVVLLNRAREVVEVNKSANALFRSGLRIVNRRLTVGNGSAAVAFDEAVQHIFSRQHDAAPPVCLPRRGRSPVLAHPLKLEAVGASPGAEPLAAVILVDLGMKKKSSEATLRIAFRLTPAEAKLAAALATGESLDRICEKLAISKETGRNQLKSIFAKTGTRRQAELVLVLARML
jgi:DNA-binding CsgD family transcriptional regulator